MRTRTLCPTNLFQGKHEEASTAGTFQNDRHELRIDGAVRRFPRILAHFHAIVAMISFGASTENVAKFRRANKLRHLVR